MGWFTIDLKLKDDWFKVLITTNCNNVGCRLINIYILMCIRDLIMKIQHGIRPWF
jgi:hypothetical protein